MWAIAHENFVFQRHKCRCHSGGYRDDFGALCFQNLLVFPKKEAVPVWGRFFCGSPPGAGGTACGGEGSQQNEVLCHAERSVSIQVY